MNLHRVISKIIGSAVLAVVACLLFFAPFLIVDGILRNEFPQENYFSEHWWPFGLSSSVAISLLLGLALIAAHPKGRVFLPGIAIAEGSFFLPLFVIRFFGFSDDILPWLWLLMVLAWIIALLLSAMILRGARSHNLRRNSLLFPFIAIFIMIPLAGVAVAGAEELMLSQRQRRNYQGELGMNSLGGTAYADGFRGLPDAIKGASIWIAMSSVLWVPSIFTLSWLVHPFLDSNVQEPKDKRII